MKKFSIEEALKLIVKHKQYVRGETTEQHVRRQEASAIWHTYRHMVDLIECNGDYYVLMKAMMLMYWQNHKDEVK